MAQRIIRAAWIILAALLLAACGGAGDEEGSPDGPGPQAVAYSGMGIDRLPGYTATFTAGFVGQGVAWTYQLDLAADGMGGTLRSLRLEGVDPAIDLGDVTLTLLGDTQYMTGPGVGEAGCLIAPAGVDLEASFPLPDDFLAPGVIGPALREAGQETVAGLMGTRYTAGGALGEFSDVTAEIVIAEESGAVLRYDFSGQVAETRFAGGEVGRLTWRFEVTSAAPAALAVPAECVIAYPIPEDAADLVRLPGLILFESPRGREEVVAYYQQTLAAQGWEVFAQPVTENETTVLSYAQGGEIITISIAATETGSSVQLFVEDRR
ncbi:MAG: hypothetical protein Kow00124_24060 [Anaerolineae bacterium]